MCFLMMFNMTNDNYLLNFAVPNNFHVLKQYTGLLPKRNHTCSYTDHNRFKPYDDSTKISIPIKLIHFISLAKLTIKHNNKSQRQITIQLSYPIDEKNTTNFLLTKYNFNRIINNINRVKYHHAQARMFLLKGFFNLPFR